jgi:hypothetical protein
MDGAACRCKNEEQLAVECADGVAAAVALLEPHFRRPEAHGHAADYLRGLIAEVVLIRSEEGPRFRETAELTLRWLQERR